MIANEKSVLLVLTNEKSACSIRPMRSQYGHLNVQEPSCILHVCLLSLPPALSTGMMVNVSECANCACVGLLLPDQPGQLGLDTASDWLTDPVPASDWLTDPLPASDWLDTELGLGLAASSLSILSVNLPG